MTKVSKQTLTINPLVSIMKMAFLFINLNLITPKICVGRALTTLYVLLLSSHTCSLFDYRFYM